MYFSKLFFGLASLASMVSAIPAPDALLDTTSALSRRDYTIRDESSLEARTSFYCPTGMSYCPWTRACSCPPGQAWDGKAKKCTGKVIKGCWPKPDPSKYAVEVDVKLGAYCAASPYKIVKYDSKHAYCQASLLNVVFLAPLSIDAEIKLLGGKLIDVKADISLALKNVCAGLAGLFIADVNVAVSLFNTNKYGYGVRPTSVVGGLVYAVVDLVNGLACLLGLGRCQVYDCVSYCAKGCKNYIDVKGSIGGYITGLIGFCINVDVILVVNKVGGILTVTIEGLLCIVGSILKSLLGIFSCNC
ncbi:hypothetical protein FALBO_2736 [Fusarium albosuccineum]|uniref:Uncharacterized protein n=1 Tax=Fusarium albosuccineum TaxID=1237068 RepID=A0A8H4LKF6_9HYPO|nr:hypothetical protein FALBO_2736 [Fusarium albosuccineum]